MHGPRPTWPATRRPWRRRRRRCARSRGSTARRSKADWRCSTRRHAVLQLQVADSRTPLNLRFDQFRRLRLRQPLAALPAPGRQAGPGRRAAAVEFQSPPARRPGVGRPNARPPRGALGPVPVRTAGRQGHVAPLVRSADGLRKCRRRPAHRRGAGGAERRDARAGARDVVRAAGAAHAPARRPARDAADHHARGTVGGDRSPGAHAHGAHRRGAHRAGLHHRSPAGRGARAAAQRPQRAAGRVAAAQGLGLARRPADRAGAQDGLPAGRRGAVPARRGSRGALAACRGHARAGTAADGACRPHGGGDGGPHQPHGHRRDRVRGAVQGGAGAVACGRPGRGDRSRLREDRRHREHVARR